MCVIVVCLDTKETPSNLTQQFNANSDGFGIAWKDDKTGLVNWRKGLYDAEGIKQIVEDTPLPHVLHFRLATIGEVNDTMCQPFPQTRNAGVMPVGQSNKVVFHNGHFCGMDDELKKFKMFGGRLPVGEMNDSRFFAMISAYSNFDSLREYDTQKFCEFDGRTAMMLGYFDHDKDTGIYYSNMGWEFAFYQDDHYLSRGWSKHNKHWCMYCGIGFAGERVRNAHEDHCSMKSGKYDHNYGYGHEYSSHDEKYKDELSEDEFKEYKKLMKQRTYSPYEYKRKQSLSKRFSNSHTMTSQQEWDEYTKEDDDRDLGIQ